MPLWSRIASLLRNIWRRQHVERELDAELHAFVDIAADEKRRRGMPEHEARRAALLELGGFDQVKEQVREVRAGAMAQGLSNDVRDAIRALRRRPLTSAAAIITLA